MIIKDVNWRFISKIDIKDIAECWNWKAGKNEGGYGQYRGIDFKIISAHRYAYELANGQIPAGLFVCHKCDNPSCVNPAHLFLGTPRDNTMDMKRKGRARGGSPPGTDSGKSKMTETQVYDIRAAAGTLKSIAKRFGISQSQVYIIKSRKQWKHLPERL